MKVKAKWNVKDETGWHRAGEVFETNLDLGDSVEVLEAPKDEKVDTTAIIFNAMNEIPAEAPAEEPASESEPAPAKTRSTTRRKVSTTK